MRLALKALGKRTILVVPAGCSAVVDGMFPHSSSMVPFLHTAFETTASAAVGVRAGLDVRGVDNVTVLAWGGDGATFDIGLQALSAAAERNENILYVCYDNEAYMNTGIQRSSATPWGAWTGTTPYDHPKDRPKKDMMAIMAAHKIPYAASASVAFPEDYVNKLKKAKAIFGTRYVQVFSPCPSGWKTPSDISVKVARLAVESRIYPLYEIEYGKRYTITLDPGPIAVKEYLKLQGRFRHLTQAEIDQIQHNVDETWEELLEKVR
ncbi:MAG: pyruvate synthase subunit beta [Gemmatimonadota bacterium]|nr:MAG: pyruvate synthase subunit beta [Gemmatimonadota bacterium]